MSGDMVVVGSSVGREGEDVAKVLLLHLSQRVLSQLFVAALNKVARKKRDLN